LHHRAAQSEAGERAKHGQQQALRAELAEDAAAVGADGDADADFALARDGAGQHEPAEIGAGDGQDEQGKHGDHDRDLVHLRLHDLHVPAGRDLDVLVVPNVFGVLAAQLIGEGAQFLTGGLRGNARSEPAPHADG